MPFYYFRIYCADGRKIYEQGNEFLNDKKACIEAMSTAREIVADETAKGHELEGMTFELARCDGSSIDKISLQLICPPPSNSSKAVA